MEYTVVEIENNPKYQKEMDKAFAIIRYNLRRIRKENAQRNSDGQEDTENQEESSEQQMSKGKRTSTLRRSRLVGTKPARAVSFTCDVDLV